MRERPVQSFYHWLGRAACTVGWHRWRIIPTIVDMRPYGHAHCDRCGKDEYWYNSIRD